MSGSTPNYETTELSFPVPSQQNAVLTAENQHAATPKVVGRPFQKGRSGNPKGRPKGSRNRLTDSVLKKIAADFATHGTEVLERVRVEEPALYLKFVLSLLPRELIMQFEQHRPSEVSQLTHDEIIELAECDKTKKIANQVF